MYVVSVSKTYWNRGVRRHRKKTKRITVVYYLDEQTGRLSTKRINAWLAPYYRTKICKRRRAVGPGCVMKYLLLAKNDKQIFDIKCPGCEDETRLIQSRLQNRVTDFT